VLTDPPYICRYRARDGETVANDDNAAWLEPAFREMYRVLKDGSFCLSFYDLAAFHPARPMMPTGASDRCWLCNFT
jgi:DNA modification methylase